ncbi:MAG: hypothetical protein V4476_19540 [Pseudomonadota bacterium]
MQSNKFTIPAGGSVSLPVTGRGFWFESGTSTTANTYIIVKPTTGGTEIRLRPGQNVNAIGDQAFWTITAEDQAAVINGYCIIGNGDFQDNNTSNLVTINASAIPNAFALPVQKQALSTITNFAPVTINTGAAQALVSDATQRVMRFRNGHATATLYLGGPGVTAANAAVVLAPGDLFIEEEAAGAAWFATSDTNGANVQLQGLKL